MEDFNPFEPLEHKLGEVFKDFIFYDFLSSSLKEGKPSEFLLETAKHLHRLYKEDKKLLGNGTMKDLDGIIRDKSKELYGVLKMLNPELEQEGNKK
jgi:hypothetical protein